MGRPVVAVVGAQSPGNVGTIARAMKNFGFSELLLVDPPAIEPGDEAHGFAGHAREDVLAERREVSFSELASFHTVGFTAITGENARRHVRYPFSTPAELADTLANTDTDTALVFGREDKGLSNEELEALDEVCSIPASEEYPVLNLGQAATVVLYELRGLTIERNQHPEAIDRADEREIEGLYEQFGTLLEAIDHPVEKQPKTRRLFRRLLGRAHPTGREVSTLRGILRHASEDSRHASEDRTDQ